MTSRAPTRSLADVVARDAPVPAHRAASIMVAVARELAAREATGIELDPAPHEVLLVADGSVELTCAGRALPTAAGLDELPPSTAGGASVGRLLFALLAGREPVSRQDAFEPVVRDALGPALSALMARSLSDAPGQWPDAMAWVDALEHRLGALAPPEAPAHAARRRRRQVLVTIGAVVLVLATVAVLVLAPRWWDSTVEGAPLPSDPPPVQVSRTSS